MIFVHNIPTEYSTHAHYQKSWIEYRIEYKKYKNYIDVKEYKDGLLREFRILLKGKMNDIY